MVNASVMFFHQSSRLRIEVSEEEEVEEEDKEKYLVYEPTTIKTKTLNRSFTTTIITVAIRKKLITIVTATAFAIIAIIIS